MLSCPRLTLAPEPWGSSDRTLAGAGAAEMGLTSKAKGSPDGASSHFAAWAGVWKGLPRRGGWVGLKVPVLDAENNGASQGQLNSTWGSGRPGDLSRVLSHWELGP